MRSHLTSLGSAYGGIKVVFWLCGATEAKGEVARHCAYYHEGKLWRENKQSSTPVRLKTVLLIKGQVFFLRGKLYSDSISDATSWTNERRKVNTNTATLPESHCHVRESQTKSVPFSVAEQPPTATLLSHTETISHDDSSASRPELASHGQSSLISNLTSAY